MSTNENVNYYYTKLTDVVIPIEWYDELEKEKHLVAAQVRKRLEKEAIILPEYQEIIKKFFEDSKSIQPLQTIIDFSYDENTIVTYPIEESEKLLYDRTGIKVPDAFAEVRKIIPHFSHLFLIYTDKSVDFSLMPHFHTHICDRDGKYNRDTRTVTVAIPIAQKSPVIEKFSFNYQPTRKGDQAIDDPKENLLNTFHHTVVGDVLEINMPTVGQCLVFDFNSTKTLHWLDNHYNENEYLFIVHQL